MEMAWRNEKSVGSVAIKIRKCRKVMSNWKRRKMLNANNKINQLHERLEYFQSKPYPCWFVITNLKKKTDASVQRGRDVLEAKKQRKMVKAKRS